MATTKSKRQRKKQSIGSQELKQAPEATKASHEKKQISSSWRLLVRTFAHIGQNFKPYLGLSVWYIVLSLVLVRGGLQSRFNGDLLEQFRQQQGAVSTFDVIVTNNGSAQSIDGMYQGILLLIFSLAFIWLIRHLHGKSTVSVKDSLYRGMTPLVPFVLVVLLLGLQLLPLLLSGALYASVVANGIAVTIAEQVLWGFVFFLGGLLSLYWLSVSVLSLYAVTLPEMTPLSALRSVKNVVKGARWNVARKLVFIAIFFAVASFLLVVPVILVLPVIAEWVLFVYGLLVVPVFHVYMFELYRELL